LTFDVSSRLQPHLQKSGNVGINRRGTLTTPVRPGEEMVLSAKSHFAQSRSSALLSIWMPPSSQ
jgi:hypothetical protein